MLILTLQSARFSSLAADQRTNQSEGAGRRREQAKLAANTFFIIFHYFMLKCLSKQYQSRH